MRRSLRAWALAALVSLLVTRAPSALAQTTAPIAPSSLLLKQVTFTLDPDVVKARFSFSEVIDRAMEDKLSNGPVVTILLRVLVFRDGDTTPVALAEQECQVTYDLWDNLYKITLNTKGRPAETHAVVNPAGVKRYCTQAADLPIANRARLQAGVPYFAAVLVDVNPVNAAMKAQFHQWMQRPGGDNEAGLGNAMFTGLTGLLLRDVGGSDRTQQFRTQTFVP
jgi:hypothetical protein